MRICCRRTPPTYPAAGALTSDPAVGVKLQALLSQAFYEDQLAVCLATEAILQVRADSLKVLPAQAS